MTDAARHPRPPRPTDTHVLWAHVAADHTLVLIYNRDSVSGQSVPPQFRCVRPIYNVASNGQCYVVAATASFVIGLGPLLMWMTPHTVQHRLHACGRHSENAHRGCLQTGGGPDAGARHTFSSRGAR